PIGRHHAPAREQLRRGVGHRPAVQSAGQGSAGASRASRGARGRSGTGPGVPSRLVIFDCDGVLGDGEGISNDVLAHALTALALPISGEEAHDAYRGMFLTEIVADAERRLGAPLPAAF